VHDRTPKHEVKIILEDRKAKVGTEAACQPVTGEHNLHEETRDNGELNCEYAARNKMIIVSTKFQHKNSHKKRRSHQMDKLLIR
jgi:outer membrane receptor for ferrienterochelin and colicin